MSRDWIGGAVLVLLGVAMIVFVIVVGGGRW